MVLWKLFCCPSIFHEEHSSNDFIRQQSKWMFRFWCVSFGFWYFMFHVPWAVWIHDCQIFVIITCQIWYNWPPAATYHGYWMNGYERKPNNSKSRLRFVFDPKFTIQRVYELECSIASRRNKNEKSYGLLLAASKQILHNFKIDTTSCIWHMYEPHLYIGYWTTKNVDISKSAIFFSSRCKTHTTNNNDSTPFVIIVFILWANPRCFAPVFFPSFCTS